MNIITIQRFINPITLEMISYAIINPYGRSRINQLKVLYKDNSYVQAAQGYPSLHEMHKIGCLTMVYR